MKENNMNSENAIEVQNVTKYFKSYADKGNMLREKLIHIGRNKYEKRIILDNISFNIKKGEAVALIGKNGCGKSTTLKMLTKILKPNSGTIKEAGRVSSLIELGAGFHPDLTGRENIYINASIFGIKAKEVDQRMDDIIRFSELEEYIDNPVRTYSSGMYMRLAFAVAINVKADILLIDEILAVGDQAFQTKCFNKLKSLKEEGLTIVLVSHSIEQVQKICDRAIWIEKGHIKEDGIARAVCKKYTDEIEKKRRERAKLEAIQIAKQISEKSTDGLDKREIEEINQKKKNLTCYEVCKQCLPEARRSGNQDVCFTNVHLHESADGSNFKINDMIEIDVECEPQKNCKGKISVCINRSDMVLCFGTSSYKYFDEYQEFNGKTKYKISIENKLLPGEYTIDLYIENEQGERCDALMEVLGFKSISDDDSMVGIVAMNNHWTKEK